MISNFNFFESSNFSKFQNTSNFQNTSTIENDNDENRWNVDEIDFFDLLYDDKSIVIVEFIEHIDKNIYFRNVTYFIERVKNIIKIKNVELIRQNFYICFRDIALIWYIIILIENEKRFVKLNNDVEKWIRVLHKRFKKFVVVIMFTITKKRYIIKNVRRRQKFMKFVYVIIRATKIIEIIVFVQIFLLYNALNLKFRRNFIKSTKNTTIETFFQKMKNNKKIWWKLKIKNNRNHD